MSKPKSLYLLAALILTLAACGPARSKNATTSSTAKVKSCSDDCLYSKKSSFRGLNWPKDTQRTDATFQTSSLVSVTQMRNYLLGQMPSSGWKFEPASSFDIPESQDGTIQLWFCRTNPNLLSVGVTIGPLKGNDTKSKGILFSTATDDYEPC